MFLCLSYPCRAHGIWKHPYSILQRAARRGKPCLANRVWRHSTAKFSKHHLLMRTKKAVPGRRVCFWRGVLRDNLLRRRWMLKFLVNRRKRQLLRSLSSDPLPEGHHVNRNNFFCLIAGHCLVTHMGFGKSPWFPCSQV